ncbi:hybrid sensor histidine kinase/response regulator [Luteitalea pratensis]|uniref:hybrid sensor histidine kinase/response regulator n=1 Tax=Luteitalea pratensis TaxID=1855912 RepID=UPI000D7266B7|nr:ATP-binding protein [Luteitalea pratensis]
MPLPTSHDDPVALTAAVHEAVAGIQQALLWGMDVDDCRSLALDAFVELTASTWGAVAHIASDSGAAAPTLHIDLDRNTRVPADPDGPAPPSRDEFAALALPHVRRATTRRAPLTVRLPGPAGAAQRAGVRASPDWMLVLPVPAGSAPNSVVLLVRGAGGYTEATASAVEPLLRLTAHVDTWAREVEARRATERELERERRRLGLALQASNVGVFEFDAGTGALQWDARLWTMHGLSPRDQPWTIGDWSSLLHPDDAHRVVDDLMASVEQQRPLETQYRIVCGDGEVRYIRSNGQIFEHAAGRLVMVGASIDVTVDVRLQQELAAERAQAEAATRAKSQFLATMSHEIRTPMNGVLGMLELLLRSGLSAEQHELAMTAHESAECLLRILNDILDLSKLESHQVSIESIPFQPAKVIADTVALLVPRAAEKNLQLHRDIDTDIPDWISGDPMRLRQVVLNLTGNAIKFTAEGHVTVRARLERDAIQTLQLRVEITDTGEGIPHEAQPRLFQHFVQADSSTSRRFGGTGLGLAISRQLVELMGGRIGLTSAPRQGSTFWFVVPAVATSPPQNGEDAARPLHKAPAPVVVAPLRILAVDDNAVNRRLVQAFLASGKHVVRAVDGGHEALAALAEEAFDLVLLDIQMPVMDGLTCLRHIRTSGGAMRDVPVIALTANAMAGDKERYLAEGFTDYVSKPMTMQSLAEAMARATAPRRILV